MWNKFDLVNIENIKAATFEVWGDSASFVINEEGEESPNLRIWHILAYGCFDVRIEYCHGMIDIYLPTEEGYLNLVQVARRQVARGFDGITPRGLMNNFQVLDKELLRMMGQGPGLHND